MSPGAQQRGSNQMPPRPPSNQAELGQQQQHQNPRMAAQTTPNNSTPPTSQAVGAPSGYPGAPPNMGPPPHHQMYGGKPPPPGSQQMPPYGQPPNYGHYGPRPGAQGGYHGYPGYGRPNSMPPGYPSYPNQPYGGQQGWPPTSGAPPPQGQPSSKGGSAPRHPGPPPGAAPPGSQYPPRQPHPGMMKGGYPPGAMHQNSYNGPQGPPPHSSYNGPGMPPPVSNAGYPGYPNNAPPPPGGAPPPPVNSYGGTVPSSTPSSSTTTNTSTTGPDGVPMHDETSQQSTLSQSSDRSDGRQTPSSKGPTNFNQPGFPPPPGSPHSSAPSPGGSMGSSAGPDTNYGRDMASPNWPRNAASPVSGPQSTKSENMMRLYEIDDNPERRLMLDKLLSFMEERGSPIMQCPTISKNPLDLFRLYVLCRERGGYIECTKNKAWKDIAAQLGIGASSSGAYTLKKHYGKNLLPFECHFDRGGIDPGPLLAQVESKAGSKKAAKSAGSQPPPAPSPGSQDSRDSFSNNSSNPNSDASYGGYPPPTGAPPGGAPPGASPHHPPPPGAAPGYNNYPPHPNSGPPGPDGRPPSHPGMGIQGGYGPGYGGHYPPPGPPGSGPRPHGPPTSAPDHYPPPPSGAGYPPPSGGYPQGPRPGWPHGPGYMGPPHNGGPPANASSSPDMYNRGPGWTQGGYGPRPPYSQGSSPSTGPPPASGTPPTSTYGSQGYQDQHYPPKSGPIPPSPTQAPGSGPPGPPSVPTGPPPGPPGPPGQMPGPPAAAPPPPQAVVATPSGPPPVSKPAMTLPTTRPHSPQKPTPDQSRPVILRPNTGHLQPSVSQQSYGPSPPSSSGPQSSYPGKGPMGGPSTPQQQQQQQQQPARHGAPPPNYQQQYGQRPPMYPGAQPGWQQRYPPPMGGYGPQERSWNGPRGPAPPGPGPWGDPYSQQQHWGKPGMRPPFRPDMRGPAPGQMAMGQRQGYPRMNFPPSSVEATNPLMMKRRKYTKVDVQPVEGWRLVMSLRSGLLMESTWALDVLNILLYDDHAFTYFGLSNMPGLIEALLEHWRASLIAMFEMTQDLELSTSESTLKRLKKAAVQIKDKPSAKRKRRLRDELFAPSDSDEDEENEGQTEERLGKPQPVDPSDKCVVSGKMRSKTDHTKRPRFCDEDVELVDREDDLFVVDDDRNGGNEVSLHADADLWQHGGGLSSEHIVTHFSSDLTLLQFVRVLKSLKQEPSVNGLENERKRRKKVKEEEDTADEEQLPPPPEEDIVDKITRLTGIVFRDPDAARARWQETALDDENFVRDEPSLHLTSETHDNIGRRAVCVSTIFRNLSFVPGNEYELSKNATFLTIVGKLLLLHHWHPQRPTLQQNKSVVVAVGDVDLESNAPSLTADDGWWWEYLYVIRENVMVTLANISGSLDLSRFEEDVCRPILNGLMEWAVGTSACAQDPFPNVGPNSPISPQRLAIETLCKMCLLEGNVDLMLSTPPYSRIERLALLLAKKLYRYEDQVLREFSINLLYYLSGADSGVARTIALSDATIGLLLGFIEQAEQNAMIVAQKHGVNALRDNPESMGTSLDMLRRAASTLGNLSRHPDNIPLFVRQEQRLLALVMSQILDQGVASILSHVLFNIGAQPQTSPPPLKIDIKPALPKLETDSSEPAKTPNEESATAAD